MTLHMTNSKILNIVDVTIFLLSTYRYDASQSFFNIDNDVAEFRYR
jgi:hypothetical protein